MIGEVKHQSIESYQWVIVHRCSIVIDDWLAGWLACWLAGLLLKEKEEDHRRWSLCLSVCLSLREAEGKTGGDQQDKQGTLRELTNLYSALLSNSSSSSSGDVIRHGT